MNFATLTRTADYANTIFMNELEVEWHEQSFSQTPRPLPTVSSLGTASRTGEIRQTLAPLDSHGIRAGEGRSFVEPSSVLTSDEPEIPALIRA